MNWHRWAVEAFLWALAITLVVVLSSLVMEPGR